VSLSIAKNKNYQDKSPKALTSSLNENFIGQQQLDKDD